LHLAVRHFVSPPITSLSDLTEGAFAFREKVNLCPELDHAGTEIPPLMTRPSGARDDYRAQRYGEKYSFDRPRQTVTSVLQEIYVWSSHVAAPNNTRRISAIRFLCASITTEKILLEPRWVLVSSE
jgi:hypothetical protein